MKKTFFSLGFGVLFFTMYACGSSTDAKKNVTGDTSRTATAGADASAAKVPDTTAAQVPPAAAGKVPPPSVILGRKEVPILCYHQIRDWKPTDSKAAKDYIMPPASLHE